MADKTNGTGAPGGLGEALGRRCIQVVDKAGESRWLPALASSDLAEIEAEFGDVAKWATPEVATAKMWLATIWRAWRKVGLSFSAVKLRLREGKWSVTSDEVGESILVGKDGFEEEDLYGQVRRFHPLTLRDLVELEKDFGSFASWGARQAHPFAFIRRMIWLSVRRDGRTPAQVIAGDFAVSEDDAGLLFHPSIAASEKFAGIFDAAAVVKVSEVWIALLSSAGVKVESAPADPPAAVPELVPAAAGVSS